MTRLGLLHTVPALADAFDRRLREEAVGAVEVVHVVDPSLLAAARTTGVTDDVRRRVLAHVRHLEADGAATVMVTCSSIAEAADAAGAGLTVPVLRVDQPMAEEAVRLATSARGRVTVLATLHSTLGPTLRLVQRVAAGQAAEIDIRAEVVEGAVAEREAGRGAVHDRLVQDAVAKAVKTADVVVLAQASMAAAVAGRSTGDTPVLESFSGGVRRLLAVARSVSS